MGACKKQQSVREVITDQSPFGYGQLSPKCKRDTSLPTEKLCLWLNLICYAEIYCAEKGATASATLGVPMEGQGFKSDNDNSSSIPLIEPHQKRIDDILSPVKATGDLTVETSPTKEIMEIGGVPEAHREERRARIYMPARTAMQAGCDNIGVWKIELDERERWENGAIGWASSADPLSNINMALSFASREDAVNFCEKNRWSFEILELPNREIKPKAYGSNFSWNKRTRVSTK
uniref:NADH dehydrogenase [ubiquinone] iron-sulfur protein 4, mitochondrial n=1 Tax=Globodera rostochiensis TaxID=31243 RepID=A0A914I608_GLORO